MKHVVMFSGGIGSWAAAKRVAQRVGTKDLILLFTDVRMEDEDLYRFWFDAAANIGGQAIRIAEGRDPWKVFFDERFLGNSRIDPCSKILKRQQADRWLRVNCDPNDTIVYVGVDWSEAHRFERLRDRRAVDGWRYEAPLCEPEYLTKRDVFDWLRREGIRPPRLYEMGFSHNNCGGFCVKAGHGHFARLLRAMPERYAHHEQMEERFRAEINADASILADRTGDGRKKPLTLRQLRLRIENRQDSGNIDMFDIGGCGCFVDEPESEAIASPKDPRDGQ